MTRVTRARLSTAPLLLRGILQASSIASQRLTTYPGHNPLPRELTGVLVYDLWKEVAAFVLVVVRAVFSTS